MLTLDGFYHRLLICPWLFEGMPGLHIQANTQISTVPPAFPLKSLVSELQLVPVKKTSDTLVF